MRALTLAFVLCGGGTFFLVGCGGNGTETTGTTPVATDPSPGEMEGAHNHPSVGPHQGTLVELGNEEFHAEITHDATSVTVYILDSTAKQSVPVDSSEVTINVLHDGAPEQFKLPANPEAADPNGKSSRFVLADTELASHLDDESASPKLSVTIDGTAYRGEIKHAHDHDGHEHAH